MDTFFGNTESTENFPSQGAGLLAQISIARTLSHFIKQFKEPAQNLIYYFCGTSFDNYVSFTNFLGNNENTHFTTGVKQIVILDSLMSNDSLELDVYNLEEDRLASNQFYLDLKKTAENMDIDLSITSHSGLLFNTTVLPIFVINDKTPPSDSAWDAAKFERKLKFLQLFFLNQVYGIATDTISEEVDESIKQHDFILKAKDFIKSVPRSPVDMQRDSNFLVDMERLVTLYTEKHIRTSYRIENYDFYRSKVVKMGIVVAKHGFTDLITFLLIILWILVLQYLLQHIGFSERKSIKQN